MKSRQNKFEKFNKETTLNKGILANVKGGKPGTGWIKSVSGDCTTSGRSCWTVLFSDILPF